MAFAKVYNELILEGEFTEDPEYYRHFRDRYWRTFAYIEEYARAPMPRVLDIGSGQFAILCRRLLNARSDVADIDSRYRSILDRHQIGFFEIDLSQGGLEAGAVYDLIVMAEVIEHVPRPPYLVFRDVARSLKPGGVLLVTTPNLYRLRNGLRILRGKPIFSNFRFPKKDQPLGHFLEYSLDQMVWQIGAAGLHVEMARIVQLDRGGATWRARTARRLLRPVFAVHPIWKDNLILIARRLPEGATSTASASPA